MLHRRRGFTLIELLVVIAIIGILAAMLFPVFARARESARKIQCLSNVKNIALAVNMYLTDYDAFPPSESRSEVFDWIATGPGAGGDDACRIADSNPSDDRIGWMALLMNPYLSWPVVLDEYIKNRDVWRCPSAKYTMSASFIIGGGGDWLRHLQANQGQWGNSFGFGPCDHMTFPAGWGGDITDSIIQGASAMVAYGGGGKGSSFVQTIASAQENLLDVKMSAIQDPSAAPICSDGGVNTTWFTAGTIAYPDICCAECSGIAYYAWNGWPDPSGCPDGSYCQDCVDGHAMIDWAQNPDRKKATARHLGGNNTGYADGHAKWTAAAAFCALSDERKLEYVGWNCGDFTSAEGYRANCGDPPGGMVFLYSRPQDFWGK